MAQSFSKTRDGRARLTRYITAQATWRKALQLDPGNEAYEKALQAAKDGEAQQTKERIEDEKRKEREAEEKRRRTPPTRRGGARTRGTRSSSKIFLGSTVWKSNFGRPTRRRRPGNCICSMASI